MAEEGTYLITSKCEGVSRWPWFTAVLIGLIGGLALWPASHGLAIYAREAILRGEIWRLYTGHFVHFGGDHVLWNLAVLLVAGVWLEWSRPVATRWFFITTPAVLGLALLWLEPGLEFYGGLSGIATGLAVLIGLQWLRGDLRDRCCGLVVLVLVGLKIGSEWSGHASIFVQFSDARVRVVPLVHLAGAIWAVIFCVAQVWFQRKPSGANKSQSGPK